ncbi:MAG TPA: HIG1 domain-containing protein [Acetobacteraceae bacterium]|jgi:hypothetical protein|nr:HIG1 domain-containing protein [Acetobacteraceae bacterium]
MTTFLTALLMISALATLGVMFAGMLGLARNEDSEGGRLRSNRLMQARVALQGLTLALFVLLMFIMKA